MADSTISALAAASVAAGANELEINEAGISKKITVTQLQQLLGVSKVKLTADAAQINNTTLIDITGLSFAVTSGVYYHFKFITVWQSGTTTTGLKSTVTIPAVTVFAACSTHHGHGTDGANTEPWAGNITTSGDAVTNTTAIAINTNYIQVLEGILLPSATGTLQYQAAAEIVAAGGITIKQGSCGILTELP